MLRRQNLCGQSLMDTSPCNPKPNTSGSETISVPQTGRQAASPLRIASTFYPSPIRESLLKRRRRAARYLFPLVSEAPIYPKRGKKLAMYPC